MTAKESQFLYGPLYQECFSLALSLTKERERALDLVQDSYYLAYKHRGGFEAGTNLRSWIKRIVYNTFASGYRKIQRRNQILAESPPVDSWINRTTIDNPALGLLGAEELFALIDEVPLIYRKSFILVKNGMSYQQIARCFNLPVGTIKSRVFTARKILKEQISSRG